MRAMAFAQPGGLDVLQMMDLPKPALEVEAEAQGRGQHPVTALRLLLDGRPYGQPVPAPAGTKPGAKVSAKWLVQVPRWPYEQTSGAAPEPVWVNTSLDDFIAELKSGARAV